MPGSGIKAPVGPISKVNLLVAGAAVSGISPAGNTVGVAGQSVGQDGVYGISDSGNGVEAWSNSGIGVKARSTTGEGIFAEGGSNGVKGQTANDGASGVLGLNTGKGNGVWGASMYGPGIRGTSEKGGLAGQFDGDVSAAGKLTAGSITTSGDVSAAGKLTAGSIATAGDVTANDVLLTGADLAEDFFATIEAPIEPGTVVVINERGTLGESLQAYDRRVAGVVSGAGDFKPGIVMDRATQDAGDRRISVALVGKVFCKVDAGYSPIAVGDLLTTSPTPGHAMKANDQSKAFGAVIGKALASLGSGTSLVPILVALQ